MRLPTVLLLLAALTPVLADEVAPARQEAEALVAAAKWDEAASAYLRMAAAKAPGWEADALNARACAGCAAAARGDTLSARSAFLLVLQEDPAQPIAKAGMEALQPPVPKPEPPAAAPEAPAPPPAVEPAEPADAGALLDEAVALGRQGRFLESRECLRRILRLKPSHAKALALLAELDDKLAEQSERAFRRHDRPETAPLPSEDLPWLLRAERARREGRLPGDEPPAPPRPVSPDVAPPEETPSEEAARRADFLHARAQAWSLAKAEAFDQARTAFEALLAAHPEEKAVVEKDLQDLAVRRKESEASHREENAKAEQEGAEASKARSEAEAAADAAHLRERYEAARALRAKGDLAGALEAFRELERLHPGYEDTADVLKILPDEVAKAESEAKARARGEALASARAALAAGRHEEARKALQPLGGDDEVKALLAEIAGDESRRAQEKREAEEARLEEGRQARRRAIEEALALAASDPQAARARLYLLQKQEPSDAQTAEALRTVDALEAARNRPPAPPPPPVPMEVRQAEALDRLKAQRVQEDCDRAFEEGRSLFYGGRLEEARQRFLSIARLAPGTRGADRYLSRIDKALRDRQALGIKLPETSEQAKPPAPPPPAETVAVRYRRAMLLYQNDDLDPAEAQLKPLKDAEGLGWWKRRQVAKALEDIALRRERSKTELEGQAARTVSEREDRLLREIDYYLDTGRKDEAALAVKGLEAGPALSEDGRRRLEALKARLEGR